MKALFPVLRLVPDAPLIHAARPPASFPGPAERVVSDNVPPTSSVLGAGRYADADSSISVNRIGRQVRGRGRMRASPRSVSDGGFPVRIWAARRMHGGTAVRIAGPASAMYVRRTG